MTAAAVALPLEADVEAPLASPPALRLVNTLWKAGALTETQLTFDGMGKEISFDRWEGVGDLLGRVKRASSWWIGDWMLYGDAAYGEEASQGEAITQLDPGTLANYVSVCRKVPVANRRQDLSFGHHVVVAPLEPALQRKWLARAVKGTKGRKWTRDELRRAIREAGEEKTPPSPEWTDGDRDNLAAELWDAARQLVHAASDAGAGQMVVPREKLDRIAGLIGEDLP